MTRRQLSSWWTTSRSCTASCRGSFVSPSTHAIEPQSEAGFWYEPSCTQSQLSVRPRLGTAVATALAALVVATRSPSRHPRQRRRQPLTISQAPDPTSSPSPAVSPTTSDKRSACRRWANSPPTGRSDANTGATSPAADHRMGSGQQHHRHRHRHRRHHGAMTELRADWSHSSSSSPLQPRADVREVAVGKESVDAEPPREVE